MNILITGAKGFIAHNLINKISKSHKVYLLVNGDSYEFDGNKITLNLLNKKHVQLLMNEEIKLDTIVHAAAKLADKYNVYDDSLFFDNAFMYKSLILIINNFMPKRVLNFSSIAVYPNKDGEYFEDSEIKPSVNNEGLYGLSKFCGENLLDLCCKGTNIAHLRISQVYSETMKVRENLIFEVMKRELKQKNTITVYGNCKRVSNFIDIDMLVNKILFFLGNDNSGIFNIGGNNLSYKDLASTIIEKYGNNKSIIKCIDKGVSSRVLINTDKYNKLALSNNQLQ
jgi:nucleoside-diphosphate-sugar epimerase